MLKLSKKLRSRQHELRLSKKSILLLRRAGARRAWLGGGYAKTSIDGKQWLLHRLLLQLVGHDLIGLEIDHKNGNPLDNRLTNLRTATRKENMRNYSKPKTNTSGFKGVGFHKRRKKWQAYIGSRPTTYLGIFDCPVKAARAYNAAAKKRYGKFAKLNCV